MAEPTKTTPPPAKQEPVKTTTDTSAEDRATRAGLVTPDAPYSPDPNAGPEVDRNISRDGGTNQVEPYAEDYPVDAKIEPIASQLNTRNQTTIGEPYIPAPAGDLTPPDPEAPVDSRINGTLAEDLAKADAERRKNREDFVKDHIETETHIRERADPYYGKQRPAPDPTAATETAASKAAAEAKARADEAKANA